ncbi:flagellar hook assembly protein FlgD [Rhodoplanes sp. SY1]|uniref:flagellar hook assembly protein FlgD n=1 Tax=Rhodoplanes sp. SY1 TaxID=3166646 RepID=UPI0038B57224
MATSSVNGTQFSATAAVTANGAKPNDAMVLGNNFQTFLQMLTTQLQNQNPLDPLDANQFTQQLVQFSQVEQQLKTNQQLETLIALEKSAQTTMALGYIGSTVAVDGTSATLPQDGMATWSFNSPKPATASISISNSSGQTVFAGTYTLQTGEQKFTWDGRSKDGTKWPPGDYKIAISAVDAAGQTVAVPTEVTGKVDSVDLTQTPPVLSVGGQTFTFDKIKRIVSR